MSKTKQPIIIKRDTVQNWSKSNYVPRENVIVLMDEKNGGVKLMIGDGHTNVNNLKDIINSTPSKSYVNEKEILVL